MDKIRHNESFGNNNTCVKILISQMLQIIREKNLKQYKDKIICSQSGNICGINPIFEENY